MTETEHGTPPPVAVAPFVSSLPPRQPLLPQAARNSLVPRSNSMVGWEKLFTPDSPYNNRLHQVFFVLNNCRALQGLHESKITCKREGAKWAKQHLDAQWHALIDYCWQERQDTGINVSQPADPRAFQRTVAFIAYTTRLAEEY
jgi:aminoglycoside adenylyltransferase-like protein